MGEVGNVLETNKLQPLSLLYIPRKGEGHASPFNLSLSVSCHLLTGEWASAVVRELTTGLPFSVCVVGCASTMAVSVYQISKTKAEKEF